MSRLLNYMGWFGLPKAPLAVLSAIYLWLLHVGDDCLVGRFGLSVSLRIPKCIVSQLDFPFGPKTLHSELMNWEPLSVIKVFWQTITTDDILPYKFDHIFVLDQRI